ncbi:hypothetical protein [Proteiniclasticum sp.]|uniref:hypothetical protein n=1 Tax=Proteiniclasticum sp. TaxID=2053595 RepID=UPI002898F15A|nr:hypothetical protein [Proteiniclasticum sp.]
MKLTEIMISMFVNMPELDNSSKTIKRMLNIFEEQEVIYNTIQIMNITNDTQKMMNRPQVINQKERYRVDFLPDRVDWVVNFNPSVQNNEDSINDKVRFITDGFIRIMKEFGYKASRMALNTQYLYDENSTPIQRTKFIAGIDDMDEIGVLSDWNTRKSFRKKIQLNGKEEKLNTIEELNYVDNNEVMINGKSVKFKGYFIHYDVNTGLFNKGERHSVKEFECFVYESLLAEKTIRDKTGELLCQQ